MRAEALGILQKEAELNDIVQLVGYDALPESEKGTMDVAKSIREDYLQQSAYDAVDTYTSVRKQYLMMNTILTFGRKEAEAIRAGATATQVSAMPVKVKIGRIKWTPEDQVEAFVQGVNAEMDQQFGALVQEVKV
jgi:V/A-type H+-transporting ATPase subunit A